MMTTLLVVATLVVITALALLLAFEQNPIDGHETSQILRDNLVSESLVG